MQCNLFKDILAKYVKNNHKKTVCTEIESESILYNVEINIEALFNVSTHIHFGIAALVAVQDDVDFGPQIMPNFIFRKCELYFVEKL